MVLHPQSEAAMAQWAQGPRVTDPDLDVAGQRLLAREEAAAEPREPVARVLDVDADGVPSRLYVPEAPRGAIVFLHGGGFVFGDLETHDAPSRRIANRTGLAVLTVDYRRPPEHRFPAAPDDVDTAVAWLLAGGPADLDHPDLAPLDAPNLDLLPPTLVIAAEHDPLVDEAVELAGRTDAAGVPTTLSTYAGMVHGFWRHPTQFDAAEESLADIAGWLRRTL